MIDNLHTVWLNGRLLAVRCLACDHRAVLDTAKFPEIRPHNVTRLRDVKLRCQSCGAAGKGAEHWAMAIPLDHEDAKRFLAGYDIARQAVL